MPVVRLLKSSRTVNVEPSDPVKDGSVTALLRLRQCDFLSLIVVCLSDYCIRFNTYLGRPQASMTRFIGVATWSWL
jgi:hypothetical protein